MTILALALFGVDMLTAGAVRSTVRDTVGVLWQGVAHTGAGIAASGTFASKAGLASENIALRSQLAALSALQTDNHALSDENAALRAQASVVAEHPSSQSAAVLSFTDASPYGSFVIGAGSADGVLAGSLVYAPGNILIGTIDSVGVHSSLVSLIFAVGRTTNALVGDNTSVTISGRGGGNAGGSVPRDTAVAVGDIVRTAHGDVLGTVGSIASSPADAQKELLVHIPINLYGLRFVTIVKPL